MARHPEPLRLNAIVLAGGAGSRLGGVDKAALEIGGVTLLERALVAVQAAAGIVVVGGGPRPVGVPLRALRWATEDPPGTGPAAGILAGVDVLGADPGLAPADLVAVLAVDMPRVDAGTIARLVWAVEADPSYDGALLVDADGRRQPLCGVYRPAKLGAARPAGPVAGLSVHALVSQLRLAEVPATGAEARDVDTWEDLTALGGEPSA